MSVLSNLKSKSRGGSGGSYRPPDEGVPFMVASYKVSNPKAANWQEDYIVGRLMRDALGLKAEFDAQGQPTTEVKVYLGAPPANNKDKKYPRPEVFDKYRSSKAVRVNGIIRADKAKLDPAKGANAVVCSWLNTVTPEYNPELQFAVNGAFISQRSEFIPRDASQKGSQNAVILAADAATVFAGLDDFRAKAAEAIAYLGTEDDPGMPGIPGYVVRIADRSTGESVVLERFKLWKSDESREFTSDEIIQDIAGDDDWAPVISANDPNYLFEVIPAARLKTGKESMPSARADSKFGPSATRDQIESLDEGVRLCRFPVMEDDGKTQKKNERGYPETAFGFIKADLFARRNRRLPEEINEQSPAKFAPWYRTDIGAIGDRKIYGPAQFLTPNVPADLAEKFEKAASTNYQNKVAEFRGPSADGPDEDQHLGTPAP